MMGGESDVAYPYVVAYDEAFDFGKDGKDPIGHADFRGIVGTDPYYGPAEIDELLSKAGIKENESISFDKFVEMDFAHVRFPVVDAVGKYGCYEIEGTPEPQPQTRGHIDYVVCQHQISVEMEKIRECKEKLAQEEEVAKEVETELQRLDDEVLEMLCPSLGKITFDVWKQEEMDQLRFFVDRVGRDWVTIWRLMGGTRAPQQCEAQWETMLALLPIPELRARCRANRLDDVVHVGEGNRRDVLIKRLRALNR